MHDLALSFVSIFSVVNPLSAIPAFVSPTSDVTPLECRRLIEQAAMAVGVIPTLVASAVEFIASGLGEPFPARAVSG